MLMKRMNERKQIKPHWYDSRKKRTEEMSGRDANTSGGRRVGGGRRSKRGVGRGGVQVSSDCYLILTGVNDMGGGSS